ncbi:unnamed protein product [Bursaphelenchus xylophilus]|uniref:(pine wood nematode) hypothetical protein n=1 Tax=Bursaphelenchus xylophilus TaxID=6326 RepID=A0A1I7S415_BURXY|nr:unnamed protein product [Bursaphelenchus xylophilus]CAG9116620.1 unnamed protein product [Bursaphelenchus xylophilus]
MRSFLITLCTYFIYISAQKLIAKFEVTSVDSRSVVVRIVGAGNVSRFDMNVHIFDLDRLKEFRRSELSSMRYEDQLFSFDGLTAGTWFAIRIHYRLVYRTDEGFEDFSTKQELIVRTKDESERNRSDPPANLQKGLLVRPRPDEFVQLEGIVSDPFHINVSLLLTFPLRSKVNTVIVPELKCELGTVKPPAQQLHSNSVKVYFDLHRLLSLQRTQTQTPNCYQLCIYPFVRASIDDKMETFRAREWCGSLEEAYELIGMPASPGAGPSASHLFIGLLYLLFRVF